MYSAGFYPYETLEEYWAYWSRYIFINRYQDAPHDVYATLLQLVREKDYFVLTTNVDHCFQKAGFDKEGFFIPRAIMDCGNAQRPVTIKPMTTKLQSGKWLPGKRICAVPSELSRAVHLRRAHVYEFAGRPYLCRG